MFDRYKVIVTLSLNIFYSINTNDIQHLKTLEKRFEKFIFVYYNGSQKHEGFVDFEKNLFQSKDFRHPNVTKLRSFLCTLLLITLIL